MAPGTPGLGAARKPNQVRIIGGRWRGRRLRFPDHPGLRPTPDRVRETLFNWLQPGLDGARCLDLFAGSGALGFEALSRGASRVVMVDHSRRILNSLNEQLEVLGGPEADLVQSGGLEYLGMPAQVFDIVFLDPPYGLGLLEPCCQLLETRGWLSDHAWIYLEGEPQAFPPVLPVHWRLTRSRHAGHVAYALAEREAEQSPVLHEGSPKSTR